MVNHNFGVNLVSVSCSVLPGLGIFFLIDLGEILSFLINGGMSLKTSVWKDFIKNLFTNALDFIVPKKHIYKKIAGIYKFINTTCGSRESAWACNTNFYGW